MFRLQKENQQALVALGMRYGHINLAGLKKRAFKFAAARFILGTCAYRQWRQVRALLKSALV
jgi:hypothetical protein